MCPQDTTSFDRTCQVNIVFRVSENIVLPRTQNDVMLRINDVRLQRNDVCFAQRCYGCAVNDVAASRKRDQPLRNPRFSSIIHETFDDTRSAEGNKMTEETPFAALTPEEKKIRLYLSQKRVLESFLERGAISKMQYDKSLQDLTAKMGMEEYRQR